MKKVKKEETSYYNKLDKRLKHLGLLYKINSIDRSEYKEWSKTRLLRVIIDYLLRNNHLETSKKLIKEYNLEDLVDYELFEKCTMIEDSLKNGDCRPCLKWCNENSSTLQKLQSNLEFDLRLQELVELIKKRRIKEGIIYAKKHMKTYYNNRELQKTLTLMAFPNDTQCPPYKRLFNQNRWNRLVQIFRDEVYRLYSVSKTPLLELSLQAGLSALKTPKCYDKETKNVECPVCDEKTFGELSEKLPFSHHLNSTLICTINGSVMDDSNLPLALPNGYVYSTKAVNDAIKNKDSKFICPRTQNEYKLSEMRKVYIS